VPEPDLGAEDSVQQGLDEQRFEGTPLDQQDGGKRKRIWPERLNQLGNHHLPD
jgi:hypothetical protein